MERRGGVGVVAVEVVDGEVGVCAVGVGGVPEVSDLFWVGVEAREVGSDFCEVLLECWVFFAVVFVPPVLACEVWCEGAVEGDGGGGVIFAPVGVQDVLLLVGGEVVPCGFDDGHDGESCRAFGEFCGVFDSPVAVVVVVHGLCFFLFLFSRLVAGGWFCLVCARRAWGYLVAVLPPARRRAVRVKPVPYAPGPSSPRGIARGSCVWLPSIMMKIVYIS